MQVGKYVRTILVVPKETPVEAPQPTEKPAVVVKS